MNVFMSADDQLIHKLLRLGRSSSRLLHAQEAPQQAHHHLQPSAEKASKSSRVKVKWPRPSRAAAPFAAGS